MWKGISWFMVLLTVSDAFGANNFIPKRFKTVTSHDDVYPYILNNTKTNSNKTTTSTNTINAISSAPIGKRSISKKTTNARAATTTNGINTNNVDSRRVVSRTNSITSRAATQSSNARLTNYKPARRVVMRSAVQPETRGTTPNRNNFYTSEKISSQRCFADYKECMEMYCQREDTAYNRCYCSAKLSQIDSKYQNKIDSLIQQIIQLQYDVDATDEEIKNYWDKTVGIYTGTNPWVNIDNALNIDWADTESRVRGQQAFNTGHEYCVQNLHACAYMASNLRDAYKSEIARDCDTYEKGLQKIQDAAESVIANYKN